ncbi:MAG TPA: site-specific integrase, partial [Thermoguttaceae bacterium]|nr:site-specific integrase [Thermoguttaceae bacterium]
LERVINPARLSSLTSATMSRFQADLRAEGMKDTTIAAHLGHLRAALGWAVSMGFLPKVPDMHKPKRAKGRKLMRGRPVTGEEFDRMVEAAAEVRPHDTAQWERFLTGLWLSGLRLEESTVFSWDLDSPFTVDLSGKHPRFRIYAEAEKGHQDRLLPMTPDFAGFILQTPEADRHGPVFPLIGLQTGKPITPKRICRILSKIGEEARVVVNRDTRTRKQKVDGVVKTVTEDVTKYASAHDLRRAFGTRWAPRVKPATLRLLMRHRSIETTLNYYVALDADELADELWRTHGPINTSINSRPNPAPHSAETPSQEKQKPLTR